MVITVIKNGPITEELSELMYPTSSILFSKKSIPQQVLFYDIKYEMKKATLSKFGNNIKDLLDDMSSN